MNLLIVDDEYYIVQGILAALNPEVVQFDAVFTAYSAEQARKVIQKECIDLLITDLEMPRENGLSLIQWMQEQHYSIVTLILTGHQRFDYAQKALSMHCFGYLLKPVDRITLNQELAKAAAVIAPASASADTVSSEAASGEISSADKNSCTDSFVDTVREFILANLSSPDLNRNAVSARVHMNPDYLSCVFHSKFGQTLSAYITNTRIDKAKELLLTTSLPLNEISDKTGFSNSSYFHKQFKKATGLTPSQYRLQKRT